MAGQFKLPIPPRPPTPALPATSLEDWLAASKGDEAVPASPGAIGRSAQFPYGGMARASAPPLSGAGAADVLTGGGRQMVSPGLQEYTDLLDALGTGGTASDRSYREGVWSQAMGGLRRLTPGADREHTQDIAASRGAMREQLPEVAGAREAEAGRQADIAYERYGRPAELEAGASQQDAATRFLIEREKSKQAARAAQQQAMSRILAQAAGGMPFKRPEDALAYINQLLASLGQDGGQEP